MPTITLEDLDTKTFTKKQIQDENVRLGLARCENELKSKSIAKLRAALLQKKVEEPITEKKARGLIWKQHFNDSLIGECFQCKTSIEVFDIWHIGFFQSYDDQVNLRPTCETCFATI